MTKRPKSSWGQIGTAAIGVAQYSKLKSLNKSSQRLEKVQQEISDLSRKQLDVSNEILAQHKLQVMLQQKAEARSEKQRQLRDALFIVSKDVDIIKNDEDTFSKYVRLTLVEADVNNNNLSPNELEELQDKNYADKVIIEMNNLLTHYWDKLDDSLQNKFNNLMINISEVNNCEENIKVILNVRQKIRDKREWLLSTKNHYPNDKIIKNYSEYAIKTLILSIILGLGAIVLSILFNLSFLFPLFTFTLFFISWLVFTMQKSSYGKLKIDIDSYNEKLNRNTSKLYFELTKQNRLKIYINNLLAEHNSLYFLVQKVDEPVKYKYYCETTCPNCRTISRINTVCTRVEVKCTNCKKKFETQT